jgi:hypothetical protein
MKMDIIFILGLFQNWRGFETALWALSVRGDRLPGLGWAA